MIKGAPFRWHCKSAMQWLPMSFVSLDMIEELGAAGSFVVIVDPAFSFVRIHSIFSPLCLNVIANRLHHAVAGSARSDAV